MLAWVFGATGYTGRNLVLALRSEGHETCAHLRPDSPRAADWIPTFERAGARIHSFPWEADALRNALRQHPPQCLFSCLGTTRRKAKQERLQGNIYEAVEGRLTRMLVDVAVECCPQSRFVFLSSVGTTPTTDNAYLKARADIEAHLKQSGLSHTIARAPFITGADRGESRIGEAIGAKLIGGIALALKALGAPGPYARYAPLTGSELARGLLSSALDEACKNRTLEPSELRALSS